MAITKTGQQYSDATPYKLNGFRYLMRYHAGVCEKIFSKYPTSKYIYIDLNCGAGEQTEYEQFGAGIYGSPIIALQELNEKGIIPVCHFCDNHSDALTKLEKTIQKLGLNCHSKYWSGNNKESLKAISKSMINTKFNGLVYSDPNGKQDFPLQEIKETFQLPQMQRVDLLLNVATTYVKRWARNPKAKWEKYLLNELINDHGKEYVFIREPYDNALKWTFVYATNWENQKELNKIRLYKIDRVIGKQIVDNLFSPSSISPPQISEDGSVIIQTNLFDAIKSNLNIQDQ